MPALRASGTKTHSKKHTTPLPPQSWDFRVYELFLVFFAVIVGLGNKRDGCCVLAAKEARAQPVRSAFRVYFVYDPPPHRKNDAC